MAKKSNPELKELDPRFFQDGLPTYQFWFRFFNACAENGSFEEKEVLSIKKNLYFDYIESDEWKERADAFKKVAGYRCQLCNKGKDETVLHAHHRTYENLGYEQFMDVTILCEDCHAKFHDKGEKQ